jgi:pimeloyl-ACP methyl ester carboxylesterase
MTPHRIDPHPKKFAFVDGKRMAYVELGEGEPTFLFLHGNPTSSYLWRNVMPEVSGLGRCVAPDLIGMGDSDKLEQPGPDTYRFATHREFLWSFIDAAIGRDRPIVLVVHDWGSALGFDWANQHRDRVKGIVYMEAIVRPLIWAEWPEGSRRVFQGFRSEAGEGMILDKNTFVERVLPASVLRRVGAGRDGGVSAALCPISRGSLADALLAPRVASADCLSRHPPSSARLISSFRSRGPANAVTTPWRVRSSCSVHCAR